MSQLQSKLSFQHHELEERAYDIRTLQSTVATLHDDMFAAQVRADESVLRQDRDKEMLRENLVKMEASALALNEENETLLADLEQLRKQAANDQEKYLLMESRCRTELTEAQEHLAISVSEMEKLEKEVEASNAKVAEYQVEKDALAKARAEIQTLKEENTLNQEKLVKCEAQLMDMCEQIGALESGNTPSQQILTVSSNIPSLMHNVLV